jgi:hypothetical protein
LGVGLSFFFEHATRLSVASAISSVCFILVVLANIAIRVPNIKLLEKILREAGKDKQIYTPTPKGYRCLPLTKKNCHE